MIAQKKYEEASLKRMKKQQLGRIAEFCGLNPEGRSREDLINDILEAQKGLDLPSESEFRANLLAESDKFKQRNDDFEALAAAPNDADEKPDRRGGCRPGAGRPKGSTADICAVRQLPEQPNEAIKASLEALFVLWSIKSGVDGVRLTQDEAVKIALPVTHMMQLNNVEIPQSAHVYIMGIWSIWEVTASKIALIREAKKPIENTTSETAENE